MASIYDLIANFPQQIEENRLRAIESQNKNLLAQENAYKLQQNIAGTNALRSVLADQGNLDPNTGLPRLNTLGPVLSANPDMGMGMSQLISKMYNQHMEANLRNLQINENLANLARENIVEPTIKYAESLPQDMSQEQRQNLIEAQRKKYFEDMVNRFGIPEDQRTRLDRPYNPSWAFQSEYLANRKKMSEQGWAKGELITDDKGNTYQYNPVLGIARDIKTGAYVPFPQNARKFGTPLSKEEPPLYQYIDPTTHQPKTIIRTGQYTFTDLQGNPVTPTGPISSIGRESQQSQRPLPAPLQAEVLQPDGAWKETGIYRYPDGSVKDANTGQTIDPKNVRIQKSEPLTGNALEIAATNYLVTGHIDPLGWASGERNRILNKAGELAAQYGMSAAQVIAMRAEARGEFAAALNLSKLRSNVGNFERTANAEADLTLALAENGLGSESVQQRLKALEADPNAPVELKSLIGVKPSAGIAKSGIPILNRWIQAGRRGVGGDPDVAAFDAAIKSLKNEYARIMSSPGATGGVTSDEARREADSLINDAMTPEQLKGAIGSMKVSMDNRIKGINAQYEETKKRIIKLGQFGKSQEEKKPETNRAQIPAKKPETQAASEIDDNTRKAIAAEINDDRAHLYKGRWWAKNKGGQLIELKKDPSKVTKDNPEGLVRVQ